MCKSVGQDYVELFKHLTSNDNGELDVQLFEHLLNNYRKFKVIKNVIDKISIENIGKADLDNTTGRVNFVIKFISNKALGKFPKNNSIDYKGNTYNIYYEQISSNKLLISFE